MKHLEEHKTALTPGEKLRVAHACLVWGWDDHKVAQLMNVNPARVSEAVTAVRDALGETSAGLALLERRLNRQAAHDMGLRAVEDELSIGGETDAG